MVVVSIAGMHRSGTSMVARLLSLCGLYLGEPSDLHEPRPDNPEGFWENVHFKGLNDAILSQLGGGWDLPPVVEDGWAMSQDFAPLRRQAAETMRSFEGHDRWGWKDPRNSLTLPFWRTLIPELKVVVCLRNPLEVAHSLTDRGFSSQAFGLQLWLTYNERLLASIPPGDRVITHYDAYFVDPVTELARVTALLGLAVPREVLERACTVASSSMRHHQVARRNLLEAGVPLAVHTLYNEMCAEAGPAAAQALASMADIGEGGKGTRSADVESAWREARWEAQVVEQGSWPERTFLLLKRGLRVWQREGFRVLVRKGSRRLGLGILPRDSIARLRASTIPRVPAHCYWPPASYDVIVLAGRAWGYPLERSQQLARYLARSGQRVFYVRLGEKSESTTRRAVAPNLFEVTLAVPHQNEPDRVPEAARKALLSAATSLRRDFDVIEAISFVQTPLWARAAPELRAKFAWRVVADDCIRADGDDWNGDALRDADLVLSPARALFEAGVPHSRPVSLLLPDAIDFDHFRLPLSSFPAPLQGLLRPIICCRVIPGVDLDSALLGSLAKARPDWSFVVVGDVSRADADELRACRNVYLFGEQSYATLPGYIHACQLGVLLAKEGHYAYGAGWSAALEFLSAGKPVVASPLGALKHCGEHVLLATASDRWLVTMEQALADSDAERRSARIDFARANDWRDRIARLKDAIPSLYPKATIVIASYNSVDYTRVCLQSIFEKTVYPNYEVIVVENGSVDGSVTLLREIAASDARLRLLINGVNEGFSSANNRALTEANGEYLVLLNSDTIVTRGWLSRLVRHLDEPSVGLVGPVSNGSPNESKIEVDYGDLDHLDAFAARYAEAHPGKAFEMDVLAFFCVAMRRSVFEQVGPLDEGFGIGMFEDDDYSLRVKQQGLRLVCAQDVYVHHFGQASFSNLGHEVFQRLHQQNRRRFERKWGLEWEPPWPYHE